MSQHPAPINPRSHACGDHAGADTCAGVWVMAGSDMSRVWQGKHHE